MVELDGSPDRWLFVFHTADREWEFTQSTFVAWSRQDAIRRAHESLIALHKPGAVAVFDGEEAMGIWETRPAGRMSVWELAE